jgi:hypothetical protein
MRINRFIEYIKDHMIIFTVMPISAYALYLRLVELANHKLWVDELFQVSVTKTSFIEFIRSMPRIEFCSYISGDYILTYPFVKFFSGNKWGLAIPHIISTIIGFYLLYLICRSSFKTIWGYLISFSVMCFNATLIYHATEIRTYAVLPTLALGVFYCTQMFTDKPKIDIKRKWLVGIFFVLTIWFHPYGVIMVLLCFMYSLGTKLYTPSYSALFMKNALFLFVVLCVAMPLWFFSVFGPHVKYVKLNPFEFIVNPLVDFAGFLKDIFGNLVSYKKLYFLLIGVILPFLIPYKERLKQIGFLFILVVIPIQLILLSDLWASYYFIQRQFIWVMPLFAFFIGWVWDSLFQYMQNIFSYKRNLHTDE